MYIEFRHLRSIRAIYDAGNLARAADVLCITQSALSHQIKGLEEQVGMELFHRRSKPMKLSPAGMKLLRLAERVLPEIAAMEEEFQAIHDGRSGRLHVAIESQACFDWLFPVMDGLRHAWPDLDLDIRQRLSFDAMEALRREEVDLVISADPVDLPGISFTPLFDYEPKMVVSASHRLAQQGFVNPEDFEGEVLLTYPMERSKIDIFSAVLTPERIEPDAVRQIEMTEVILMRVAAGRGVAVLPDWVLRRVKDNPDFVVLSVTGAGISKRMFAATREEDVAVPYMAHMLRLCRSEPVKLQR